MWRNLGRPPDLSFASPPTRSPRIPSRLPPGTKAIAPLFLKILLQCQPKDQNFIQAHALCPPGGRTPNTKNNTPETSTAVWLDLPRGKLLEGVPREFTERPPDVHPPWSKREILALVVPPPF